jgi:DNA-binding NtrC family response regulator
MPANILIVDDEPDMLKLLTMIIKGKTNYATATTNNPLEALEMFKSGNFDLVIADMKMPGMDGIQLFEHIKKITADVPIVMITAYGTFETANEIMEKGVFDFIRKPFRKEQILYTIDKALKWYELQKENKILKERLGSGETV